MIKKIRCFGLIMFTSCAAISANEGFIEAKAGYFLPTNSRLKKNCSGSGIYGLEGNYQLWKYLYSWLGADYFTQSGHTQGQHNHISMQIVRINAGLKCIYNRYHIRPYIGFGPQAAYLNTHVNSSYLIRKQSNWGAGCILNGGVNMIISHSCILDFFSSYSWQTIDMHRTRHKKVIIHDANISGFTFGGAWGYRF